MRLRDIDVEHALSFSLTPAHTHDISLTPERDASHSPHYMYIYIYVYI